MMNTRDKIVKSYSDKANPNMRRSIVKQEVLDLMRTEQQPLSGFLAELAEFASTENVPIIPVETQVYLRFLLQTLNPTCLLEVGTAIGFSALLMADSLPEASITTLERNPEMGALAQANFERYDSRQQINLVMGDALDSLPQLKDIYDFVFMDSAKSKYIVFLPEILRLMPVGGVVMIDDVFQGGDVAKPFEDIKRGQRAIYKGLRALFDATLDHPGLTSSLLPLGDGVLMIRKNQADISLLESN